MIDIAKLVWSAKKLSKLLEARGPLNGPCRRFAAMWLSPPKGMGHQLCASCRDPEYVHAAQALVDEVLRQTADV